MSLSSQLEHRNRKNEIRQKKATKRVQGEHERKKYQRPSYNSGLPTQGLLLPKQWKNYLATLTLNL